MMTFIANMIFSGAWIMVGVGVLGAFRNHTESERNGAAIAAVFSMCILIYLKLHTSPCNITIDAPNVTSILQTNQGR